MLFLKPLDVLGLHQGADTVPGLVEQVTDIDNTRLTAELPRFDHVGV